MDDVEVEQFWNLARAPRYRWLIGGATFATILVASLGWHLIWKLYGCDEHFYGFWVRNGVWLGIAACSLTALAWPSRVSRLVRLATLLPVFHLVAVVVSVVLWTYIHAHAGRYSSLDTMIAMPWSAAETMLVGGAVLVASAWLIQRREWTQTMLVLALSFLLLFGAWLPFHATAWFDDPDRSLDGTLAAPVTFLYGALVPPLVAALAFTTFALRWPTAASKMRGGPISLVAGLLATAIFTKLVPRRDELFVYGNTLQLVVMAQALAIAALIAAGLAMWFRARRARTPPPGTTLERATIADPDGTRAPVVEVEITGWLRAPTISTRPFELITPRGRLSVSGAPVIWSIPADTTRLGIGEHCAILRRGDAVTIHRKDTTRDGGPFRSVHHADELAIAAPETGTPFTNVTVMLWRPATAYVVITLAVMVPAALALLAT